VTLTSLKLDQDNKIKKSDVTAERQFDLKEYVRLIKPIESETFDSDKSYDSEHVRLGTFLFDFLFGNHLEDFYRKTYEDLENGERLRIRLFVNDAKLSNIAWEFVYDSKLTRYLSIFPRYSLTRFPGDVSKLKDLIERPKVNTWNRQRQANAQLLFVSANAIGDPNIAAQEEITKIKGELEKLNTQARIKIAYQDVPKASWTEIYRELNEGLRLYDGYNILHFYGHGAFQGGEATLIFQRETDGGQEIIRPNRFGQLLDLPLSQNLQLVFINACDGAKSSEEDPQSGLAQSLFASRLSNVASIVAMQFPITIDAVAFISQNLYSELARGAAIEDAVQSTRLMLSNYPLFKEKRFFATPVIFMNTNNGYLFGFPDFKKDIREGIRESKIAGVYQPQSTQLDAESKVDLLNKCYPVLDKMVQVIRIAETLKGKSSVEISPFVNAISPTIVSFVSGYTGLLDSLRKAFPNLDDSITREAGHLSSKIGELVLPFARNAQISDVGDFLQTRLDEIRSSFEDFWKFITKVTFYEPIGVVVN